MPLHYTVITNFNVFGWAGRAEACIHVQRRLAGNLRRSEGASLSRMPVFCQAIGGVQNTIYCSLRE